MKKKSFLAQPLFWILLVLFFPAAIFYAIAYASKQAEESREIDEEAIRGLNSTPTSVNTTENAPGMVKVNFVYKKNPLQLLLLSKPNLSINDSSSYKLENNQPLSLSIPSKSKIRFAVPYLFTEAGMVEKALNLDAGTNYRVEFTMGLFVFSPATVNVIRQ